MSTKTRSLSSHVSTCRNFISNCLLKPLVSAVFVIFLLLALLLSVEGLLTLTLGRSVNTRDTPRGLPRRQLQFTRLADVLTPTIVQTSQTATTWPQFSDHTVGIQSMRMDSVRTTANASRTTLQPKATTDGLAQKPLGGTAVSAYRRSTPIAISALDAHTGIMSGTQIITANSKTQFVFSSGQTLSVRSRDTLGAGNSPSLLAPSNFGTQDVLVSGSSMSLSSHATVAPDVSKKSPLLTISGQTTTADSMSQYHFDNQTLTPVGASTAARTVIPFSADESGIAVGTRTKALSANNTANINSGSDGTNVQSFKGSAVGVGDGLWTSSMVVVAGVAVLLWL